MFLKLNINKDKLVDIEKLVKTIKHTNKQLVNNKETCLIDNYKLTAVCIYWAQIFRCRKTSKYFMVEVSFFYENCKLTSL